jgi:hypothetical protein
VRPEACCLQWVYSGHSVVLRSVPVCPYEPTCTELVGMSCTELVGMSPLPEVIRSLSPRASTWLRWSFGQPGLPQSFFQSREVFALPRAHQVFEIGNTLRGIELS